MFKCKVAFKFEILTLCEASLGRLRYYRGLFSVSKTLLPIVGIKEGIMWLRHFGVQLLS